ncbi:hypothetical protein ANO14919_074170 [Xylariales sp. No.14919]|nr:hypothetical protein ANO14919_074170 [Xylariales sp. No.14919]
MPSAYWLLSLVILALTCARLLTNWFHLSKAPGPILAGATDLWRAYQQYNGQLRAKISDLHARHGPIVRYGVRSISINDPEAESYKVIVGIQNGKEVPSLGSTQDETRHDAIRRSIANAFTQTAALGHESQIDATIEELLVKIGENKTLDLSSMILWYTMDAAGRFSFGESLGCLAAEGDVGGSIQLIRDRFNHWGWWSSLPRLERLVFRNPIAIRQQRAPSSMAAAAMSKLRARSLQTERDNEHVDLLQKFLIASKNHPQTLDTSGVVGMLMSTISGAGDTTATTMTAILFQLLRNPDCLKKLEAELMGLREIPAYSDFKLADRAPSSGRGFTIAGMSFPEGTSVGCLPSAIHQNKGIYGEDADIFRPDRWLVSDREQVRVMEAAHMGFSRGRRVCLGQNIAVMQLKKVITALVMKYKFSLLHPGTELEADFSPAVACLKPLHVAVEAKP